MEGGTKIITQAPIAQEIGNQPNVISVKSIQPTYLKAMQYRLTARDFRRRIGLNVSEKSKKVKLLITSKQTKKSPV